MARFNQDGGDDYQGRYQDDPYSGNNSPQNPYQNVGGDRRTLPQAPPPYPDPNQAPQTPNGGQMYTGGTPNFNEANGQYYGPDNKWHNSDGSLVNGTGDRANVKTGGGSGTFNGQIDPSRAMDPDYIRQVMQWTAQQTGHPYDPNAESYWIPKILSGGGMSQYWLTRLMAPDSGGQGGGGGAPAANLGPWTPDTYTPPVTSDANMSSADIVNQVNQLAQFLLGRATGNIKDSDIKNLQVSADDPLIKGQVDSFLAQQQRSNRDYLSKAAEQAGANTNLDVVKRSMAEQAGFNTSNFEAQLLMQELNNRRNELQQALSGETGFVTQQQQLALQKELAQLQQAQALFLAQQAQKENESQYERDLAQRSYQFDQDNAFRHSPLYNPSTQ